MNERKKMNRIFIIALAVLMMHTLMACHTPKSTQTDSLPKIAKQYDGYRLAVTDLIVKKKKSKAATVQYALVNTGRETIRHFKNDDNTPAIYFDFGPSLEKSDLTPYKNAILAQVLNKDFTLHPGKTLDKQNMKIQLDDPSQKNDDTFTIDVGNSSTSSSENYIDRKFCPDLRLDTILLTRKTKRWITLEFKVTNVGKGPAALRGDRSGEEDNLAIKAHLSSSSKLSRGAIPIGGMFINDKELLKVGETYTGIIRLDASKKTRFTSNIILELDPYQTIRECDETNNRNFIEVK